VHHLHSVPVRAPFVGRSGVETSVERTRDTPATRKGLNRVVKNLQFPNPNTLPVRLDGSTPRPHLSIAERFKVPLFELMKVWAVASKQRPVSQLYSSVKLLYVSSPSILSSPSPICLFPRTSSYSIPHCGISGCPHYLYGTVPRFRAAQSGSLPTMFLESQPGISLHPCPAQYLLY